MVTIHLMLGPYKRLFIHNLKCAEKSFHRSLTLLSNAKIAFEKTNLNNKIHISEFDLHDS